MKAIDNGKKRAVIVWHRRSGKDFTLINLTVKKAFERVGAYYYFFPTYRQGKKIMWDGIDRDGNKFLHNIPPELIKKKNDTEMKIELINGSIFQIIGSDNVDSIVGTNPVGCVFSEYALQDPRAWDFIRPILAENGGWVVFNFTPRGMNHAYDIYNMALNSPDEWFVQKLTVDETQVIDPKVIEQEKLEMDEELFMQEYYCSFEAGLSGSYYAKQLKQAEAEDRITTVPIDLTNPVYTAWDLGMNDTTAIWFFQMIGSQLRIVDYYENNGEGLEFYRDMLQEKNYNYGNFYMPHDIKVKELGTGKSRYETAKSMGIGPIKIVPMLSIGDGINAVRTVFNRCWFDRKKCDRGLTVLRNYVKEFDEKRNVYKSMPYHNWASNGADAFRYLAIIADKGYNKGGVYRHGY